MTILRSAAALLCLAILAPGAPAQCVDWTAGYHVEGIRGTVHASAVFDDGSGNGLELYLGGDFEAAGEVAALNIVKWNGTRWAPLGPGRVSPVNALLVWDDGSGPALLAGCDGTDSAPPGGAVANIARWNGSAWTGLPGEVAVMRVRSFAIHDDGSGPALYIGARFTNIGGWLAAAQGVARFDGTSWSQVGAGLFVTSEGAYALAVHDDGGGPKLFAGGYGLRSMPSAPPASMWRWDGAAWANVGTGFGPQALPLALSVAHSSTGVETLYAGGIGTVSITQQKLMRWNGSGWDGVGPSLQGSIWTLMEAWQPGTDALLYAGGQGTLFLGLGSGGLGIWTGTQWTVPFPLAKFVRTLAFYDEGAGPKLFAGLNEFYFSLAAAQPRGIARLDGPTWVTPGPSGAGEGGAIEKLTVFDDGSGPGLYACGVLDSNYFPPAPRVAQLVGQAWMPVGAPFSSGTVLSIRGFDDGLHGEQLHACGSFVENNGFSINRISRWDGTHWHQLGAGLGATAWQAIAYDMVPYDDGTGERLVVVGDFNLAGSISAPFIAAWDGAQWSTFGSGFNNQTRCAVVHDDGSGEALYVGGIFTHAGGVFAPSLARWNGSTWSAVGTGPGFAVLDLLVHDDGSGPKLYAGSGGFPSPLKRWDGIAWQSVPGAPAFPDALVSYDDGSGAGPRLCVAGSFGGTYGACFDGSAWQTLGTGITSPVNGVSVRVNGFAVFDDGNGPALFAGGDFVRAGAHVSVNIARFGPTGASGCTPVTGAAYCFGDGTGTACPCGNNGLPGHGCASSANPQGATLVAEGQAHLSSDTVTLRAAGMPPTTTLLFFQGTGQTASGLGVPFGDGLRCVNGTIVRLAVRGASGGAALFGHAIAGDPSVSTAGHLPASWTTRNYQAWYRDAQSFCTSAAYNLTNGISIRWAP